MQEITIVLDRVRQGDRAAWDVLYRLAFYRLRTIASGLLRKERPGHTLQPTALIAESFVKLRGVFGHIQCRDHFFSLSARAMRQVLIDHSRKRRAIKIHPDVLADLLPRALPSQQNVDESMNVRRAFARLQEMDALAAESIWMRYVDGLTIHEVSSRQGREAWSVRTDCMFGLKWMAQRLTA